MKRWETGFILGLLIPGLMITGVFAEENEESVTMGTVGVTGTVSF